MFALRDRSNPFGALTLALSLTAGTAAIAQNEKRGENAAPGISARGSERAPETSESDAPERSMLESQNIEWRLRKFDFETVTRVRELLLPEGFSDEEKELNFLILHDEAKEKLSSLDKGVAEKVLAALFPANFNLNVELDEIEDELKSLQAANRARKSEGFDAYAKGVLQTIVGATILTVAACYGYALTKRRSREATCREALPADESGDASRGIEILREALWGVQEVRHVLYNLMRTPFTLSDHFHGNALAKVHKILSLGARYIELGLAEHGVRPRSPLTRERSESIRALEIQLKAAEGEREATLANVLESHAQEIEDGVQSALAEWRQSVAQARDRSARESERIAIGLEELSERIQALTRDGTILEAEIAAKGRALDERRPELDELTRSIEIQREELVRLQRGVEEEQTKLQKLETLFDTPDEQLIAAILANRELAARVFELACADYVSRRGE